MSNIIDAFLVTFGMDPKDFKHGVEEVTKDQEKLRQDSKKTADEMKQQGKEAAEFFRELIAKAGEFFGVMAGIESLKEFTKSSLEAQDAGGKLARMLDIDVASLQGWQRAVQLEGGSAESFNSSLKGLNSRLAMIAIHGPRAQMMLRLFAGLGLNEAALHGKNVTQVLELLSEKMKDMSGGKALGLGQRIGLDEGTVRLLMRGKEGVQELVEQEKALGTYTEEDSEKAEKFNDDMENAKIQFEQVGQRMLTVFMPVLQMVADGLLAIGDWAKKHPQIVQAALIGIAAAIGVVAASLVPVVIELLPIELIVLAIAAAVGLVAAGVYYLYAEWKKWTEGGESSLGKLFTFIHAAWEQVKSFFITSFNAIRQTISDFIDYVVGYFQFLWAVITLDGPGIQAAWDKMTIALGRIMKRLFNYILYELGYFIGTMTRGWDVMWERMKTKAAESLLAIGKWWRDLNPALKFALVQATGGAAATLSFAPTSASAIRPSTISTMSTQSSNTRSLVISEMNINTQATDAKGIAGSMHEEIAKTGLVGQSDTGMGG